MIASIGKYYNPAQEYRPDSSLFQRNPDIYIKQDLHSWWEDVGVWAGDARPNTHNFLLNCVTPIKVGKVLPGKWV